MAQWSPGSGGAIYYDGGNVGIGTQTPGSLLNVTKQNANLLTVGDTSGNYMVWYGYGYNDVNIYGASLRFYVANNDIVFRTATMDPVMTIKQGGSVGIGTTSPQHLLHVAGIIGAEQVIVSSTGADYVFGPDYKLTPLTEVESYIKEHHHLPDIPSEAEVTKSCLNIGDMQTKLLAKIEELTLHAIRAEETSARLEQQNRELQERIARLEKER